MVNRREALAGMKAALPGTVKFIFQPAEEGRGGALAMINDGLFQRFPCDEVYGLHNRPGLAVGKYGIRPGAMMAGGHQPGRGQYGKVVTDALQFVDKVKKEELTIGYKKQISLLGNSDI